MQNCFDIHGLTRRAQHYQHFGANEAWQEGETMRQKVAKIIRIGRTDLQDPVELTTHRVRFFNLVDIGGSCDQSTRKPPPSVLREIMKKAVRGMPSRCGSTWA